MRSSIVAWFGTGHERRAKVLVAFAVVLAGFATVGVLGGPETPRLTVADEPPEQNTLVALQGYKDEGKAVELNPEGEVVWQYADPDDVFDAEALGPDRIQLSTADEVPDSACPDRYRDDGSPGCVRNSLRIVEQSSKEVLWEYTWYDVELHEHELHDADHYTVNATADAGNATDATETDDGNRTRAAAGNRTGSDGGADRWVMVDMGNDRVFAVNRRKEVVWEWYANETYDPPSEMGPEGDWTHVNDVDRLRPGVFQVSLRNFDSVVELHVGDGSANASASERSITVEPVVGPNQFAGKGRLLYEQHNPDRLADGHLLVADSERDRVVELNRSGAVVWEFGGSAVLDWPRDADRLPNGHTLVTDSYNDRVVEVSEDGEIVWAVETGTLPYEADRLPAAWSDGVRAEGSSDRPTATEANLSDSGRESLVERYRGYVVAISKYALPIPVAEQVVPLAVALVALVGAAIETVRWRGVRFWPGRGGDVN